MSQTKHDRKQIQKRQRRDKDVRRKANIERNTPSTRYRLDVEQDGKLQEGIRYFRMRKNVDDYKSRIEIARKNGMPILSGRIVDTVRREVVAIITASKMKGAAPDKIEDGVKAEVPVMQCGEN